MKKMLKTLLLAAIALPSAAQKDHVHLGTTVRIPEATLRDKIRGGWAGQTIGVTFGGPYEFKYDGTFIQDYQPLFYSEGYIRKTMLETPGLYDDLYMDLTFVDVFERLGLDAPVDSFANAFAHAGYKLWHANQAARYNILHGIKPPASGNWIGRRACAVRPFYGLVPAGNFPGPGSIAGAGIHVYYLKPKLFFSPGCLAATCRASSTECVQ